ncbi:MAG: hypothetical protein AB7O55_00720 [Lautropia sp.]
MSGIGQRTKMGMPRNEMMLVAGANTGPGVPALGVIHLERGLAPGAAQPTSQIAGSIMNPATFGFPVIVETAEGAWVENVVRGDANLVPSYVAAARRLTGRGAVAISSTCGFAIRYQKEVAAAVDVPVALSSLLLIPMLLRQFPAPAKIAVLTYDSTRLEDELLGVDDAADRARLIVGGIEGGKYWRDEQMKPPPPTDVAAVEKDVAACIARLRAQHPQIETILFECAGFPMVASSIRRITGLPVYDITTLARCMLLSVGAPSGAPAPIDARS